MSISLSKILNAIVLKTFLVILVLLSSCRTPPEYSNIPFIAFRDIESIGDGRFAVTFYFEDGNADLGLDNAGADISPPFNTSFYITAKKNNPCQYIDTLDSPNLGADQALTDTVVRTIDNPTGRNIELSLLVQNGENFERRFYGLSSQCNITDTVFHPQVRFPRISETINDEPVDGTIRFEIDLNFTPTLSTDTLQLEFFIYDRALNKSNSITTSAFPKTGL